MTTYMIRAERITTRHEIVRGGESDPEHGKRRTAHKIAEISTSSSGIELVLAGSWERVRYEPKQKVRVKDAEQ